MNKKKLLALVCGVVVVVAIVVLCFLCCGGKKEQYCSVIPKDAVALMRLDAKSFISKNDIDLDPVKALMGKQTTEAVENCGIDFSQSVYAFYLPNGSMGMCAKVSDADALKKVVEDYGKTINAKLSEKQGYNWIDMNDMVVAFDGERLVGISGGGMYVRKNIISMMEQDKEESVLSTSMFETISKCEKTFAIVFSSKAVPADIRTQLASFTKSDVTDLDLDLMLALDFDKDKAILSADVLPNSDKAKALFTEESLGIHKINGKFISTGVANPFAWFTMNVQGKKFAELLGSDADLIAMLGGLDVNKGINSFNGDVTVVCPTAQFEGFLVQAEVSDNSLVTLIEPAAQKMGGSLKAMKIADNSWCVSDGQSPLFMGMKGNNLFYTASTSDLGSKAGQEVETGLEPFKEDICNSYVYSTVDASSLVTLVASALRVPPIYLGRLSNFDRLTFKVTSPTHAEFSLSVKDGKDFIETVFK